MESTDILTIGDVDDHSTLKDTKYKHYPFNFPGDFKERTRELLLDGTTAICKDGDDSMLDRFCASFYMLDNPPRRCFYFYWTDLKRKLWIEDDVGPKYGQLLTAVNTLKAQCVFAAVKKRLSGEKWINERTLKVPAKSKISNQYVQNVVFECLEEEEQKLLRYMQQLQLQYKNNIY